MTTNTDLTTVDSSTNIVPSVKQSVQTPIWLVVAIAALISFTSSYATWYIVRTQTSSQVPKVVVVDMARIVIAKGFQSANSGEQAESSAKKFLASMEDLNEKFTQEGVLVINSQAAFNRPLGADMTAYYAKSLGVDLSKK